MQGGSVHEIEGLEQVVVRLPIGEVLLRTRPRQLLDRAGSAAAVLEAQIVKVHDRQRSSIQDVFPVGAELLEPRPPDADVDERLAHPIRLRTMNRPASSRLDAAPSHADLSGLSEPLVLYGERCG